MARRICLLVRRRCGGTEEQTGEPVRLGGACAGRAVRGTHDFCFLFFFFFRLFPGRRIKWCIAWCKMATGLHEAAGTVAAANQFTAGRAVYEPDGSDEIFKYSRYSYVI